MKLKQTRAFRDWRASLDPYTDGRVLARIKRIAEGNFGDCKPVGEGVLEARIHFGPGYRLYFIRRGEAVLVLLCGGDKSTQNDDIKAAKRLAKEN